VISLTLIPNQGAIGRHVRTLFRRAGKPSCYHTARALIPNQGAISRHVRTLFQRAGKPSCYHSARALMAGPGLVWSSPGVAAGRPIKGCLEVLTKNNTVRAC
jgi:hypothetical protein